MSRTRQPRGDFNRLDRPPSLTARVEQLLRQALAEDRFPGGRLPTEMALAEQLGISRETVRLAAETLQREGLLVKIRRKGTFVHAPRMPDRLPLPEANLIGYLQAGYQAADQEEEVSRVISGLMLQGAVEEASRARFPLLVLHAPHTQLGQAFEPLAHDRRLAGVIFAHFGEEKLLRRVAGASLPAVLLDHDLPLPGIHSVRDDSFEGARLAVRHLAGLGHRRIAFMNWRQVDLNPWRREGYRQGLRDAGLPRRRRWELSVELTRAGARAAVEQFLKLAPRPTAVYCFNNTLAAQVIDELKQRGLRIPEEVSVLGGGGEDVPGLTCHQADWHGMGRLAVQTLLRACERTVRPPGRPRSGKPAASEHHLSPHAIRPGTTASVAGRA